MSFETYETSDASGAPHELYLFRLNTEYFAYTNSDHAIEFFVDGDASATTFIPIPIDRDKIVITGSDDKTTLNVSLPRSADVSELFRVFPPSDTLWLTIFEGHDSDPDAEFMAIWAGRVLSSSRENSITTLSCEPVTTGLRRPGLRRRYQYGCPHQLYGRSCGVQRDLFTVTATITAVSGYSITLAAGWAGPFPEANFANGLLAFEGGGREALRSILQVDTAADTLTIAGAIPLLAAGDQVKLSLGCDHTMVGCNSFANIHNFGGQPWIPYSNPLGNSNKFY